MRPVACDAETRSLLRGMPPRACSSTRARNRKIPRRRSRRTARSQFAVADELQDAGAAALATRRRGGGFGRVASGWWCDAGGLEPSRCRGLRCLSHVLKRSTRPLRVAGPHGRLDQLGEGPDRGTLAANLLSRCHRGERAFEAAEPVVQPSTQKRWRTSHAQDCETTRCSSRASLGASWYLRPDGRRGAKGGLSY